MNALFLKDLAAKTHRGMRGRAEAGKAAAGISFGYDAVKAIGQDGEPTTGERAINPIQAEIVKRIFLDFVSGKTPAAIVRALNADGIPGPQGQPWQHTTIRGHAERGTGILNNEIYIGRQIWNRMRYLKDPTSGRRVSRMNPRSEWVISDVPHLRIVNQEIWDQARHRLDDIRERTAPQRMGRQNRMAHGLVHMKKPKWLLSGLLTCGVCGGSYAMRGIDRYGCANRSAGTCANGRTVRQSYLEEGVLSGLKDRMLAPDVAEMAMKGFIEEVNKQNHARRANERAWQAELAKTQKAIGAIITAIEEGLYNADMKARMADLQNRKSDLQARLDHETVAELDKLPSLAKTYREKVQRLTVALNNEEEREGAAEALRGLIDRIVLTPGEANEMYATIHGEYGNILNWLADQCRQTKTPLAFASGVFVGVSDQLRITTPEGVVKLVAGARFELTTFTL